MRGDTFQRLGEVIDEIQSRFSDEALIVVLVFFEPLPVVVLGEVGEVGEEPGGEVTGCHGTTLPNTESWGNPSAVISYQLSVAGNQSPVTSRQPPMTGY
jgi:hypothetical protein